MSTDFSPNTGLSVYWAENGTTAYVAPATATAPCPDAMPTSDPGAENIYFEGVTGGSLTAAGKSDYVTLQLVTSTAAAAGDTSLAEFTLQYDES